MNTRIACLVFCLFAAGPVFAWHTNTHVSMTRDAISLLPEDFQQIFQNHQKYVELGITDPDLVLKDWQNHFYIPSSGEGGALDRIDKIIKIVEIKSKAAAASDLSKQLCYLAHYVADLWSPESILRTDPASDLAFVQNHHIVVVFEGYNAPIEDIRAYLEKRSKWRFMLENNKDISTLLYNEAVNDIVNVWLTLWNKSGKEIAQLNPMMLEHKPGVLKDNLLRYLSQKERNKIAGGWYEQQWTTTSSDGSTRSRVDYEYRPSATQLYGNVLARNETQMMTRIQPQAPFQFMETSLKPSGDNTFFVARIKNIGTTDIVSFAVMIPGQRGAFARIENLKPGQVTKLEATLPPSVTKENIQVVFALPEDSN